MSNRMLELATVEIVHKEPNLAATPHPFFLQRGNQKTKETFSLNATANT